MAQYPSRKDYMVSGGGLGKKDDSFLLSRSASFAVYLVLFRPSSALRLVDVG